MSLGFVKKLIQQRRHTGDIGSHHHRSGRKPLILASHRRDLRALLAKQPDLTLAEIRERLGLACTVQAIHYVLADMGPTHIPRQIVEFSKTTGLSRKRSGHAGCVSPRFR